MKLMIASDLHGSALYCRKMIERFEQEKADRLLFLGDLLYHGPRNDLPEEYDPKAVIAMLNRIKEKLFCVRGNCDTEVDQMVLEFPIMADYAVFPVGTHILYATHGDHWNEKTPLPLTDGDILLGGHTHIPQCEEHNNILYLNPGSVSIPKENSCHSYMTLQEDLLLWKELKDGRVYREYRIR